MPASPSEEYAQRLGAREVQLARLDKLHDRVASIRLLLVAATIILAWCSLQLSVVSSGWLLISVVAFVIAVAYHGRVRRERRCAARAADVYREGLARIADRWAGRGQSGERFADPHHIYSADLDLFGPGGLFELLSNARTRMGEATLAQWLLAPAPVAVITARHAAINELRTLLDLREELNIVGEQPVAGVRPETLLQWAEAPNRLQQHWIRWLAPLLALFALATMVVWYRWGLVSPLLVVVVIEAGITWRLSKQLNDTVYATENAFEDLDLLTTLLARLEREQFQAPRLQMLMQSLTSHRLPASQTIKQLRTLVQLIESRRNPLLALLNVPLMYSMQVAVAAEAWRRRHGHAIRPWLQAIGEVEALLSLATYSYEHPADPFPEFVDGPASFAAVGLCHPLIPAANAVRNDVSITTETRVLLVSGSNMSGKSTLLRSVGINTVLAMAGAPVRAWRLQLTELQIGASIRINDSLHEGNSRFYAEIKRLRQIYDLAGRQPQLLFLLDELLQGTNSADRRAGAEGVVQAMLDRGAIGLISTHDLALTDIGGSQNTRLHNVHFQDDLDNGKMQFDFKLREGVVTKSNALALMRSIGLDV